MTTELQSVLLAAAQAMDDWITTYAADHCRIEDVHAAWRRIVDNGGTLAYAAKIRDQCLEAAKQN